MRSRANAKAVVSGRDAEDFIICWMCLPMGLVEGSMLW